MKRQLQKLIREAVERIVIEHQMSERHSCALVGLSRDTNSHVGQNIGLHVELCDQIVQTTHTQALELPHDP